MKIDIVVETETSTSIRARQVSAMFDAPPSEKCRLEWSFEFPIEEAPWNVGLIVGPSGSGKSTVMRHVWGEPKALTWEAKSVVDDFPPLPVEEITGALSAVGFNSVPNWMRPFRVLSNGEQFRCDLARRLVELPSPVVVDEFTSVVDRQVAQIGSHAVQKMVRKLGAQFVAVSCHYDVIDWLQPDWVLDMATRIFTRRLLQRRPLLDIAIGRVSRATWESFAPFHYMTASLPATARDTFGLWVNGRLATFCAVQDPFPHPKTKTLARISRVVTLPDFQGIGLAFMLMDKLGAAYRQLGKILRISFATKSFDRAFAKSPAWRRDRSQKLGTPTFFGLKSTMGGAAAGKRLSRGCASFAFAGAPLCATDTKILFSKQENAS